MGKDNVVNFLGKKYFSSNTKYKQGYFVWKRTPD